MNEQNTSQGHMHPMDAITSHGHQCRYPDNAEVLLALDPFFPPHSTQKHTTFSTWILTNTNQSSASLQV